MTAPNTGFRSLLVANRGEIARRILRTARELGLRTVAVYAEGDRHSPHVAEADVAVALGGSTAAESYLAVDRVLDAAARTGADAVHPGYGFLSEQAPFARAVLDAGLGWVGPPPAALAQMGDKLAAKALAARHGVPVAPSAEVVGDEPFEWAAQVAAVGYPLLLKAAAGGGGRGMRVVQDPDELPDLVVTARREAAASFADGRIFAERYLAAPRHIEIQVVADQHGSVVHLGERECSVQRRHQKLLEESPSPAVGPALRARLGDAAVGLARAIGYVGAGTVEFLVEDGTEEFVFLEVNARLQVEHPVTEAVTGLDLVRLQLEVASGAHLAVTQSDVDLAGHAIEARVTAEDPLRDWLPTTGRILRWRPGPTPGVRYDSGVVSGVEVGPQFDPLLAKVIVHAATRPEATRRLARALRDLQIAGLRTGAGYLAAAVEHPDFEAGATTTAFVDDHPPAALLTDEPPAAALVAAALADDHAARDLDARWAFAPRGWRSTGAEPPAHRYRVGDHDRTSAVVVRYPGAGGDPAGRGDHEVALTAAVDGRALEGRAATRDLAHPDDATEHEVALELDGIRRTFRVVASGDQRWVHWAGGRCELRLVPRFPDAGDEGLGGGPTAPVPGRVVAVEVGPGDPVSAGQTLVVLEAMKVEHRITAAADGRIAEVLVAVGDTVEAHQLLVRTEEEP